MLHLSFLFLLKDAAGVLTVVVGTAPLRSKVHVKPPEDTWNLKPLFWFTSDFINAKHSVVSFQRIVGSMFLRRRHVSCATKWWKLSESSYRSASQLPSTDGHRYSKSTFGANIIFGGFGGHPPSSFKEKNRQTEFETFPNRP